MAVKIESTSSPQSKDLIRIFLRHHPSGVLATADAAAHPHAAVIYYLLEDDFSILFATKQGTQKYKNMDENGEVTLVVYDESTQTTVQIMGHAEFVDDETVRGKVLDNMGRVSMERSVENIPPAAKLAAGDYKIVRINPTVIKLAEYLLSAPGNDNLFETISFSK